MMTPVWTFQVHKTPQKAPKNYKTLPPYTGNGNSVNGVWKGSGFSLDDLNIFSGSYREDLEYACRCNSCHSRNVFIIYLDHTRDQSGCDIDLEVECLDCKVFTLAKGWN